MQQVDRLKQFGKAAIMVAHVITIVVLAESGAAQAAAQADEGAIKLTLSDFCPQTVQGGEIQLGAHPGGGHAWVSLQDVDQNATYQLAGVQASEAKEPVSTYSPDLSCHYLARRTDGNVSLVTKFGYVSGPVTSRGGSWLIANTAEGQVSTQTCAATKELRKAFSDNVKHVAKCLQQPEKQKASCHQKAEGKLHKAVAGIKLSLDSALDCDLTVKPK